MTAGDVPRFSPGIHNPADQLNDLARRVGALEALRFLPPLDYRSTPAGGMVSLIQSDTAPTPLEYHLAIPQPAIVYPPSVAEQVINMFTGPVSISSPGAYLIIGQLAIQTAGPGTVQFRWRKVGGGGVTSGWCGLFVPAGTPAFATFAVPFATYIAIPTSPSPYPIEPVMFSPALSINFDATYSRLNILQMRD
jgi:hypothetical protein